MKKHLKQLELLIRELEGQVTPKGKSSLIKLFTFLEEFEKWIAGQEFYQPITIGMFQASAKVDGINWPELRRWINDLIESEGSEKHCCDDDCYCDDEEYEENDIDEPLEGNPNED